VEKEFINIVKQLGIIASSYRHIVEYAIASSAIALTELAWSQHMRMTDSSYEWKDPVVGF
jgi:hypothetical protein